jgi:deoxyribodipyrimidine photolyase-related protein
VRHLVLVLGDQLNGDAAALDGFDPAQDALWMAEVREESTHVRSHRARSALFLAAMRQFRERQRAAGRTVHYRELGLHAGTSLADALAADLRRLRPARVIVTEPGDWRVREALRPCVAAAGLELEIRTDRHFVCRTDEFAAWARGRREFRLEHFYRVMRRRTGILMDGDEPAGGTWNFDADNRASFDAAGPGLLPAPRAFPPDGLTREALDTVRRELPDHPGSLERFDWPVTPTDARLALEDFLAHRLPLFGRYQDAMWAGEPWLYHSRLSAALNLKLLDPLEVCRAVEREYRASRAPLAAVEGFVRQVLGWREYVRGLYWHGMPAWLEANALGADRELPWAYWSGETDLACLRDALTHTLEFGYAHHIERLMVTGLFALLVGVQPRRVHEWYLAVYVDAVEWAELPNTLGMSQFADGGRLASKPYIASGRYIERMSNHCAGCRYRPGEATGPRACPFTTLYWDFLDRHAERFRRHPRLGQQVRNLDRKSDAERAAIRAQARALRDALAPRVGG